MKHPGASPICSDPACGCHTKQDVQETYTLWAEHKDNKGRTLEIAAHKSWASICGHMQRLEGDYAWWHIIRDRDGIEVLKYDEKGL